MSEPPRKKRCIGEVVAVRCQWIYNLFLALFYRYISILYLYSTSLPFACSCVSLDESLVESFDEPSVEDESVHWLFSLVSLEQSLAEEPPVREEPAAPDWSVGAEESAEPLFLPWFSLDESLEFSVFGTELSVTFRGSLRSLIIARTSSNQVYKTSFSSVCGRSPKSLAHS
jgi:hypothetical protein